VQKQVKVQKQKQRQRQRQRQRRNAKVNATAKADAKSSVERKCSEKKPEVALQLKVEWAVSAQLFAFRIARDCLRPLHFLGGRFAKKYL
jgi:hypothetical protein